MSASERSARRLQGDSRPHGVWSLLAVFAATYYISVFAVLRGRLVVEPVGWISRRQPLPVGAAEDSPPVWSCVPDDCGASRHHAYLRWGAGESGHSVNHGRCAYNDAGDRWRVHHLAMAQGHHLADRHRASWTEPDSLVLRLSFLPGALARLHRGWEDVRRMVAEVALSPACVPAS
jgi:hypothetical protein